jgi:hypothetical protein
MDELDKRCRPNTVGFGATTGSTGQYDQERSQALAATGDNVIGDLIDQANGAVQSAAYRLINGRQLPAHQAANPLKRLAAAIVTTQLSVSPREIVV